ncbi:MAG: DUF4332 domain-containing protein [Bacteroidales bacterium]|jgi:predicted flap endonuclease-1-like 5' DNA nuclease|nr:DUF4332 domain-containing protein [Bacteroidales bacterium]
MSYSIDKIEGIGAAYADKLKVAGIKTTDDLLTQAATRSAREKLAEATGISEKLILRWANHADLFRIKGISSQFAELLEAAGVDTVKEFRHRVPENLHAKLDEINAKGKHQLSGRVPSVKELSDMIAQAQSVEPKISY